MKAEWRAHHGRLILFFGNKNTAPLGSVRALILPPAHLKMEPSSVPDTIPPRAQVSDGCLFIFALFFHFLGFLWLNLGIKTEACDIQWIGFLFYVD